MFQPILQLRRYAVQGATGGDALRAALGVHFPDHRLELGPQTNSFRAQIGLCPLSKLQVFYGSYEKAFRLCVPNSRHFIEGFPIRGSAETINNRIGMTSSPGNGTLAEPGEISFSAGPEFEHVVVLMDPDVLSRTFATLVGMPSARGLKLDSSSFGPRPQARLSRGLVKLLVQELDVQETTPSPLVIAELEQAILVAFLCSNKHSYSHLLDAPPRGAAPWQLRRIEEYIEANWDQPISIEALAVVAAGGEATVTNVAFACGFGNLGHFAVDYQRAFGEAPSITLHRAKAGRRH
jgi:hypothetical protein